MTACRVAVTDELDAGHVEPCRCHTFRLHAFILGLVYCTIPRSVAVVVERVEVAGALLGHRRFRPARPRLRRRWAAARRGRRPSARGIRDAACGPRGRPATARGAFSSWKSRSSSLDVAAQFDDFRPAHLADADAPVAVLAENQRLAVLEVDDIVVLFFLLRRRS